VQHGLQGHGDRCPLHQETFFADTAVDAGELSIKGQTKPPPRGAGTILMAGKAARRLKMKRKFATKKIFCTALMICALTSGVFGQSKPELETITYTNMDGQRKTVKAVYFGLFENYFTLDGSGENTWLIKYQRFRPDIEEATGMVKKGKWDAWEKVAENLAPYVTNVQMQKYIEGIVGKTVETTMDSTILLMQHIKSENGGRGDYWWENKRELHWLSKCYIAMP
jgi:hypothetical protein